MRLPPSNLLLLLIPLLGLGLAAPSEPAVDLAVVKDIFGDGGAAQAARGGYGGEAAAEEYAETAAENVGVIINVIKEEAKAADPYTNDAGGDNYVDDTKPDDYVDSGSNGYDVTDVEVNKQYETCAEYTEQFGYECVPYYQCQNGTIITDGEGLIDIRGGFGSLTPEDSKCPGFLEVCCKDPDFVPPPPPKIVYKPRCGRRNVHGIGARIQGFKDGQTQFAEFPHMCAVLHDTLDKEGKPVNLYKCGGSLIAPGVVLTAAHCFRDFKYQPSPHELKVRCGEWDTQQQIEPYKHEDRHGAAVKIHPEFNAGNLANDFALIFLEEDFKLNFHIDTVCLPKPNQVVVDKTRCVATGWGKDQFGAKGEYQVVLKEVDLHTVDFNQCQDKLKSTRLGKRFKLHNSFICAGGEAGKDTCKGDGGSPLVCPVQNYGEYAPETYEQVGIVAWGIGCGEQGIPGVYASVSEAVCWIDYAMTCYYGDNDLNSYWSNEYSTCGVWFENKLKNLPRESLRNDYTSCSVKWLNTPPGKSSPFAPGNFPDPAPPKGAYVDPAPPKGAYVDPAPPAEGPQY